ncbi:protein obstructor-E-like [Eriocheir sinensis]|uniref:protein obstructor-E-like n=1 Tax=Eriocheir sinensis TaxID=95602 RepID=UPI0021C93FF1|nr:protein obstructor-E-like [Eriocheir sinensis]
MKVLFSLLACAALAAGQSCPPEGVQYFPDSSQCDRYTECREGVATDQLCPDGLLFNDKITDGRYPCFYEPEVDCGSRTQRQPAQPTEFCAHQWGYFGSGDSAQCGYFYNCVNGFPFRVDCPAGLAFSSATYRCEWPDESPDCDAAAFLGFSCPADVGSNQLLLLGFQQFRSPRDCREFFICVGTSPRVQYCQLGLVFDEVNKTCVEPELVQGCQDYYTPEELALYREQREKARVAAERRQAELQALREKLAERRRQQQSL